MTKWKRFLSAFWQVSYSLAFIFLMVILCTALLWVPDQSKDMIDEFGQESPFRNFFMIKAVSVGIWTATVWQCSRIILLFPDNIDLAGNWRAVQIGLVWVPRLLGIAAGLFPGIAFCYEGHWAHGLLMLGYVGLTAALLIVFEGVIKRSSDARYYQPIRKKYKILMKAGFNPRSIAGYSRGFFSGLRKDFRELTENASIRNFLVLGLALMLVVFILFLVPVIVRSPVISQSFSAIFIVLSGLSFFTALGSVVVYFSGNKVRPLFIVFLVYILAASFWNDNTTINECADAPLYRTEIKTQFARWLEAREAAKGDSLPLIVIATEGGGVRGSVWTSELLFGLNRHMPGFNEHTFAISGVSGGGVGAAFYLAFLHDSLSNPQDTVFTKANLDQVLREDFLSPVIGGFIFNESIQMLLPWPVKSLERTKRLEDAWSYTYKKHFNPGKARSFANPFDSSFTSLYKNDFNYRIPSFVINGTLAETGQKTIVSNLVTHGNRSFMDVVDILHLTQSDMPLKTAATMCSRFPFIMSGGRFQAKDTQSSGIQSGHVTDGGYFDNTGMETAIQLVTALLPTIDSLRADSITVIPYILFFKNSTSGEYRDRQITRAQRGARGLGIPVNSFYNPWGRGSGTRDALYQGLAPFTHPQVRYMSFKLDYRDRAGERLRLPLGMSISDTAIRHIQKKADTLFVEKARERDFINLQKLVTHRAGEDL